MEVPQEDSEIQYKIEIQDNPGQEVMLVLDLDGQELPASVAQTIVELTQSGCQTIPDLPLMESHSAVWNYQDVDNLMFTDENPKHEDAFPTNCRDLNVDESGYQSVLANVQNEKQEVFDKYRNKMDDSHLTLYQGEETGQLIQFVTSENVSEEFDTSVECINENENQNSLHGNIEPYEIKVEVADISTFSSESNLIDDKAGHSALLENCVGDEGTCDNLKTNNQTSSKMEHLTLDAPKISVFNCDHCTFSSNSEIGIGRHTYSVHNLKKCYKCFQCQKTFEKELSLQVHSLCHKNLSVRKARKGFFICPLCDFECTLNKRLEAHYKNEHLKQSKQQLFSCAPCKFACLTSSEFEDHKDTFNHRRKVERLRECPVCSLACVKLEEHISMKHSDERPFLCTECGFRAKVESTLKGHMLTHIESKDFVCTTCQRAFKSSSRLKRHMKIHDPVKKYSCSNCAFSTNANHDLKRHMKREHGKKTEFACKHCELIFLKVSELKHHALTVHQSKDRHYCEYCEFSCVTWTDFRTHLQQHNEKHRFFCTECSYSTTWKCHYIRHYNTHMDVQDKPFACTKCSYSSWEKMNLKKHMVVHSEERPFSCNLCSYKCKSENSLNMHKSAIHSDLRPFKCERCTYSAKTSGNLKKHLWIHEQNKPFQCPYCVYSCREGSKLRRHISTKHANANIQTTLHGNTNLINLFQEGTEVHKPLSTNPLNSFGEEGELHRHNSTKSANVCQEDRDLHKHIEANPTNEPHSRMEEMKTQPQEFQILQLYTVV